MSATNEFVFFSSSDTHVTATATPATNLKIHQLRFSNNVVTSTGLSSPVNNNFANNGFAYLESNGNGYLACSFIGSTGPQKTCHGDRFLTNTFAAAYANSGPSTFRYRKFRGNGTF